MNIYTDEESKTVRQEALLDAVRKGTYGTQESLVRALKKQGITATQASVSRDISELGLIKVGGRYQPPGGGSAGPPQPLRAYVKSVGAAGSNLVVIKTSTGTAQQVGLALDHEAQSGVVGTIAGDDTVFVAFESKKSSQAFVRRLTALSAGESS